jgi:hypothetical protein
MSEIKRWDVGSRVVSLRSNGAVIIADAKPSGYPYEQYTLAGTRAGLLALIAALEECAEAMYSRPRSGAEGDHHGRR